MKKIVKIEFEGQAKAVVAKVKLEYEFDNKEETIPNDTILKEAQDLYSKANSHADLLTKAKLF